MDVIGENTNSYCKIISNYFVQLLLDIIYFKI